MEWCQKSIMGECWNTHKYMEIKQHTPEWSLDQRHQNGNKNCLETNENRITSTKINVAKGDLREVYTDKHIYL